MDSKQKMASVVLMPQYLVTGQAPYGKIYIRTAEISAAEELKESWESRGFTDVRIKNDLDGCDDVAQDEVAPRPALMAEVHRNLIKVKRAICLQAGRKAG